MLNLFSSTYDELERPMSIHGYGTNAFLSPNGETIVIIDVEKSTIYFYDKHQDGKFYQTTQLFNYYFKNQNTLGLKVAFDASSILCVVSTDSSDFINYETDINNANFTSIAMTFLKMGDNKIPRLLEDGLTTVFDDTFMWEHLMQLEYIYDQKVMDLTVVRHMTHSDIYIATESGYHSGSISYYQYDISDVIHRIDAKETELVKTQEGQKILGLDDSIAQFNPKNTKIRESNEKIINDQYYVFKKYIVSNDKTKLRIQIVNRNYNNNPSAALTKDIIIPDNLKIIDYDIVKNDDIYILTQSSILKYRHLFSTNVTTLLETIPIETFEDKYNKIRTTQTLNNLDQILIASSCKNKVRIYYHEIPSEWESEEFTGEESFGYNIDLKPNQFLVCSPYKGLIESFQYEPLTNKWLAQTIQSDGFAFNFNIDQSENIVIVTNSNERTLDIYENCPKDLLFLDSDRHSTSHQMGDSSVQYKLNEDGTFFAYLANEFGQSKINVIRPGNNKIFGAQDGSKFAHYIDIPLNQFDSSEFSENGEFILTNYQIYKLEFDLSYNHLPAYVNIQIPSSSYYPVPASKIKLNSNATLLYAKESSSHKIYDYYEDLSIRKDHLTNYLIPFYSNNNSVSIFKNKFSTINQQPEIITLDASESCLFCGFDPKNNAYLFNEGQIQIFKPKDKYEIKYTHDVSFSSIESADIFSEDNMYIFKRPNEYRFLFLDPSSNFVEYQQVNPNFFDLTNYKYKFFGRNVFRYSTSNSGIIDHFRIGEVDVSGSDASNNLLLRNAIQFTKVNEMNLGSENIRGVHITSTRNLIVVTTQNIYSYLNQSQDDKKLIHMKRFYESKPSYDLLSVNKQYYYNANRILGSKFLSNYADEYADNNYYVFDTFDAYFIQKITNPNGIVGEYTINYDNVPLFFPDRNTSKYIDTDRYNTIDSLTKYINNKNKNNKVYELKTRNYIKAETYIRNGSAPVGKFIGWAILYFLAAIIILGPFTLGFIYLVITALVVAIGATSWSKYEEVKNSGRFGIKAYDSSGVQIEDAESFFRYNNDLPTSITEQPSDPDPDRLGGDGWKYRVSEGNTALRYDPVTNSLVPANTIPPYYEFLSTKEVDKFSISQSYDLQDERIVEEIFSGMRELHTPNTQRNTTFYFVRRFTINVMKRLNYAENTYVSKNNTIYGGRMDITPDGNHIVLNSDLNTIAQTELEGTETNLYNSILINETIGPWNDSKDALFPNGGNHFRTYNFKNTILDKQGFTEEGIKIANIFGTDSSQLDTMRKVLQEIDQLNQNAPEPFINVSYKSYAAMKIKWKGGRGWVHWGEGYIRFSTGERYQTYKTDATGVENVEWYYDGWSQGYNPRTKTITPGSNLSSKTDDFVDSVTWEHECWFALYGNQFPVGCVCFISGVDATIEITGSITIRYTENFNKKYINKLLRYSTINFFDRKYADWRQNSSIVFNTLTYRKPKKIKNDDTKYLKIDVEETIITAEQLLTESPLEKVFIIKEGLILGYKNNKYLCYNKNVNDGLDKLRFFQNNVALNFPKGVVQSTVLNDTKLITNYTRYDVSGQISDGPFEYDYLTSNNNSVRQITEIGYQEFTIQKNGYISSISFVLKWSRIDALADGQITIGISRIGSGVLDFVASKQISLPTDEDGDPLSDFSTVTISFNPFQIPVSERESVRLVFKFNESMQPKKQISLPDHNGVPTNTNGFFYFYAGLGVEPIQLATISFQYTISRGSIIDKHGFLVSDFSSLDDAPQAKTFNYTYFNYLDPNIFKSIYNGMYNDQSGNIFRYGQKVIDINTYAELNDNPNLIYAKEITPTSNILERSDPPSGTNYILEPSTTCTFHSGHTNPPIYYGIDNLEVNDMCNSPSHDFYVTACRYSQLAFSDIANPEVGRKWYIITLPNPSDVCSNYVPAELINTYYNNMKTCIFANDEFLVGGVNRIYKMKYNRRNEIYNFQNSPWQIEQIKNIVPVGNTTNPPFMTNYVINSFAVAGTRVVGVGNSGLLIYKNTSQTTWNKVELQGFETIHFNQVIYNGSVFVIVGDELTVLSSNDGVVWFQVSPNKIFPQVRSNVTYLDSDTTEQRLQKIQIDIKNYNIQKIFKYKVGNYDYLLHLDSPGAIDHSYILIPDILFPATQKTNYIGKSSENKNQFVIVRNNIVSILETTGAHDLEETKRFRIQDEIGKIILSGNDLYNCLPDRGVIRKYDSDLSTFDVTGGEEFFRDDSFSYFGSNISKFKDYFVINADNGVLAIKTKLDQNYLGTIQTNFVVDGFASTVICRDRIYINDPYFNKLFIVKSIPYINISMD